MSPEQKIEFDEMKRTLTAIKEVLDVSFIENVKRRIVVPSQVLFDADSSTSGIQQAVDEAGSASYSVAGAYDDAKIITLAGINYKIGVYDT